MARVALEARRDRERIVCPACGLHACDLRRDFGIAADYECACGWRFRADREGIVIREFGYAA